MRNVVDFLLLAALWGASFLFIRIAAPEFGPIAMLELRVIIASLFLYGLLMVKGKQAAMWNNIRPLFVVGMLNSAIPFALFGYAMLVLSAGFGSIINATTPMFAALVAFFWLKDRLTYAGVLGLVIGFIGVIVLVWGKGGLTLGGTGIAIAAALVASFSYGVSANYAKRYVSHVDPLPISAGTQITAATVMLPFALWMWPTHEASHAAWISVTLLGIACTGIAFILYYRLVSVWGVPKTATVTFLIPVFGMIWGNLFLGEQVTMSMLTGCAIIILGTAMATGRIFSHNWLAKKTVQP
ncbi:MAG: DMT family transporter [Gammaproteobacteria bacterium]|nr:DMT family transporter [Gammaproteobacteria bacterium]